MSEHELVERIKNGDKQAFREVYEKYASLIYRYISVRVGNEQDVEDLVAKTFVKAWEAFSSFEWQGVTLGSWLIRIAHNLVVDMYRSQKEVQTFVPHQHGKLQREYTRIENRDVIRQAFDTLSYDEQMILYLHYFEGYLLKEVAEFVDKTPNAVRVAKYRALQRMRDALTGEDDND